MSALTLPVRPPEEMMEMVSLDRRGITIANQIAAIPFKTVKIVRSVADLPRVKVLGKE